MVVYFIVMANGEHHTQTYLKAGVLDPGGNSDEALVVRLGAVLKEVLEHQQPLILHLAWIQTEAPMWQYSTEVERTNEGLVSDNRLTTIFKEMPPTHPTEGGVLC